MIAGVFVVLVVSVMSMSYLQLSLNKNRENSAAVDAKRAFYMAEAGLAEGYLALTSGKSGVVASPEEPAVYGNGVFWVEALSLSRDRTQLRSTGLSGTGRDSLTVVVERTTRTLADFGVFGDNGVYIGLGATILSYDSRDAASIGDIDPDRADEVIFGDGSSRLRVGSNQNITFVGTRVGALTIDGDAIPGPTGSVVIGPGISVSGSTAPSGSVATLRTPEIPDVRAGTSFSYNVPLTSFVHEPVLISYDTMAINAGKVTIAGPAKLVVQQLSVATGAELAFDTTNGPIRIHVNGSLKMAPGSILSSVEQDPTQLMLLVGASDRVAGDGSLIKAVQIESIGNFYGLVYSPDAVLTLKAGLNFHGTLIGKKVTLTADATLHFDEALLDALPDGSQIASDLISWRFVELPTAEIVKTKMDPIKWMKLRGADLNKPSETHDEDWDGKVENSDIVVNRLKEAIVN